MRIIFCDDDADILQELRESVSEFFQKFEKITPEYALYRTGEELLEKEKDTAVDLAFLDVEMPGISGIHVGPYLKKQNPHAKIFIVTAYPDYLDEAMRFQVFRYLSKPLDKNRLFRNLKDALYQYHMESTQYLIETEGKNILCRNEDILCVETVGRRTLIHMRNGDFESPHRMDHWVETLHAPCFYLSHRSFLINLQYVLSFDKDTILLRCGEREISAYLSRRKYTHFKDTFLLYLESVR